ncbi:hypothetical protein GQ44DRAFT_725808 [Phaeosphaeriaceae sp. PMI808]|nr:hypothetical protein GQ44DRAFT_725808 [Phaeosphaeriaceae sp. PMI808]
MLWKQSFILAVVLALPAFAAPAPQRKVPSSQQLNCDAAGVCCDQFGGCVFRKDLRPEFEDRIVNKRDPEPQRKVPSSQQLNCNKNNQGVDVCCDQFGGCILRGDLSPGFEDRIVNKREAEA